MKTYLVTGGAGFIGSHITEELLAQGHKVIILDDMTAGIRTNVFPQAEFIQGSVTDGELLHAICEEFNIGGIFHLAAVASVQKSVEDPMLVHDVNATGTLNVLLAAKDCGVRKVVLSASAAAYGDDPVFPKRETMIPQPLSPYAVSKIAGEMYCDTFTRLYGLQTVALRYFNVFGPRQDPNSEYAAVIPKFTEAIVQGRSPVIFGDGMQTRDFVFVKDVVQANLKAMQSDACGLFNIGRGEQTSLNQLAQMIMEAVDTHADVIYKDPRAGDIRDSVADITKAREMLGYEPAYSVADGIRETVEYFRGLMG